MFFNKFGNIHDGFYGKHGKVYTKSVGTTSSDYIGDYSSLICFTQCVSILIFLPSMVTFRKKLFDKNHSIQYKRHLFHLNWWKFYWKTLKKTSPLLI